MDDHFRILQERIETLAVERDLSWLNGKWRCREVQKKQEEDLYGSKNRACKR